MIGLTGNAPSSEPALLRVLRRKSSSSVMIPPSSDSSSNGSTGDTSSELCADPGEICAELTGSGGKLKSS